MHSHALVLPPNGWLSLLVDGMTGFGNRGVRRLRGGEMDSNHRSLAEFGNFVLAGVSFAVSQFSNGLSDRTCHALCCATAPANGLFAGNDVGAIATAHVSLVAADLTIRCTDSQVTNASNYHFYNKKETLASRAAGQTLAFGDAPLAGGFGARFCIDDDAERAARART